MDVLGELSAHDPGDLEQGPVAGQVAVCLVDQAEVVDVDQGHPDAAVGSAAVLEQVGQQGHRRAVVEQAGQGVPPGGLLEVGGLPGQPALGSLEDEIEQQAQDECGAEHDDDDLARGRGDRVQDRLCFAVDLEDGRGGAIGTRDWEVFLEDLGVGRETSRPRVRVVGRYDRRSDLPGAEGFGQVIVGSEALAAQAIPVAVQDGLIGREDLDVEDSLGLDDQGLQLALDLIDPGLRDAAKRQVGGRQVCRDQRAHDGLIRSVRPVHRGRLDAVADDRDEGDTGRANEEQAGAEDQEQEPGAAVQPLRMETRQQTTLAYGIRGVRP